MSCHASAPRRNGSAGRKATLVCQRCGRVAPFEEWSVEERDDPRPRRVVVCPDCGFVLVAQPRFAAPA